MEDLYKLENNCKKLIAALISELNTIRSKINNTNNSLNLVPHYSTHLINTIYIRAREIAHQETDIIQVIYSIENDLETNNELYISIFWKCFGRERILYTFRLLLEMLPNDAEKEMILNSTEVSNHIHRIRLEYEYFDNVMKVIYPHIQNVLESTFMKDPFDLCRSEYNNWSMGSDSTPCNSTRSPVSLGHQLKQLLIEQQTKGLSAEVCLIRELTPGGGNRRSNGENCVIEEYDIADSLSNASRRISSADEDREDDFPPTPNLHAEDHPLEEYSYDESLPSHTLLSPPSLPLPSHSSPKENNGLSSSYHGRKISHHNSISEHSLQQLTAKESSLTRQSSEDKRVSQEGGERRILRRVNSGSVQGETSSLIRHSRKTGVVNSTIQGLPKRKTTTTNASCSSAGLTSRRGERRGREERRGEERKGDEEKGEETREERAEERETSRFEQDDLYSYAEMTSHYGSVCGDHLIAQIEDFVKTKIIFSGWIPLATGNGEINFFNPKDQILSYKFPSSLFSLLYEDWYSGTNSSTTDQQKTFYHHHWDQFQLKIHPSKIKDVFMAAYHGDIIFLTLYFIGKGDVDVKDDNGRTPLMYSIEGNDSNTFSMLLKSNANIFAKDDFEWTALGYATKKGSVSCVGKLIEAGVSLVKPCAQNDRNFLHIIAVYKQHCLLKFVIGNDNTQYIQKDKNNGTPLDIAREMNDTFLLEWLKRFIQSSKEPIVISSTPVVSSASVISPSAIVGSSSSRRSVPSSEDSLIYFALHSVFLFFLISIQVCFFKLSEWKENIFQYLFIDENDVIPREYHRTPLFVVFIEKLHFYYHGQPLPDYQKVALMKQTPLQKLCSLLNSFEDKKKLA